MQLESEFTKVAVDMPTYRAADKSCRKTSWAKGWTAAVV
jgi:hypothetical protein